MQDKRFGYFDDDNREYVITDPKTPWPWINYLGNEDFFSLISNTAGGYSFYKDAKFRRITRYRYNNVPMDNGGRYFYINEGGMVSHLEALQDCTRQLRVSPRHELHPHHRIQRRHRSQPALLRPTEDLGRGAEADLAEYFCQSEKTQTILLCRMVLVECRYGHGELPA